MIRTMQDLLDVGVNAFAIRLLAKDFEKMRHEGSMSEPIHVPIPVSGRNTIWVTFSDTAPPDAQQK